MKEIELNINCPQCGHTKFEMSEDLNDDDFVKCEECEFEIMLSDLKSAAIEDATDLIYDEVSKILKKSFKNFK